MLPPVDSDRGSRTKARVVAVWSVGCAVALVAVHHLTPLLTKNLVSGPVRPLAPVILLATIALATLAFVWSGRRMLVAAGTPAVAATAALIVGWPTATPALMVLALVLAVAFVGLLGSARRPVG